jgi:peroxiredoxin
MNAKIVAITTEGMGKVKRMVRKLNLSFPVASDQTKGVVSDFQLLDQKTGRARTATVLIDADGRIRWFRTGKSSSDHPNPMEILNRVEMIS